MKTTLTQLLSIQLLIALVITPAIAQNNNYTPLNDILSTLNPLEIVENIDGIKRSIDLKIQFEKGSAKLLPAGKRQLEILGKAMSQERLLAFNFQVIGHTDASGDAAYNQTLSELRAESAVNFLTQVTNVDKQRLLAVGKGETQLKPRLAPNSPEHRRVEIIAIPMQEVSTDHKEQKIRW